MYQKATCNVATSCTEQERDNLNKDGILKKTPLNIEHDYSGKENISRI
jgi:hypothetical protein